MCIATKIFARVFLSLFIAISSSATLSAQAIQVSDSLGAKTLAQIPVRAVVLDWDLLEQVIELGIMPVGAPEISSYQHWVIQPAIDSSVLDVGTRSEPNLEIIAELNPDVIIISATQIDLMPALEKIAPVLYYSNFAKQDKHAQLAIKHFKQLAQVFAKSTLAVQKLQGMNTELSRLKAQLATALHSDKAAVLLMRLASQTSSFVYAENSIPHYALQALGLSAALPQKPAKWGIVQKRLSELQHINEGYVLYILPFAQEQQLKRSILWRALPFVQQNRVNAVRSVWSYGGAMSILYTAQAITESLLELVETQ